MSMIVYNIKWNSLATSTACIFKNSWPLYLNFSNMINLCPNIWCIKNSKCQQFLFWKKKEPPMTQKIYIFFKRSSFLNELSYWYECWRVFRDFCRPSKVEFSNFTLNVAIVMPIWMSKIAHNSTAISVFHLDLNFRTL